MQNAQQFCYLRIIVLSFLLTHLSANNLQTELITKDQHAFGQDSNANSLNIQKSLYMTEIDYTLLTAKKLEPNFGLIQVQIPQRRVVACDNCQKEMELEEGTVIYDKKWFHDSCWQSITRGDTIVK